MLGFKRAAYMCLVVLALILPAGAVRGAVSATAKHTVVTNESVARIVGETALGAFLHVASTARFDGERRGFHTVLSTLSDVSISIDGEEQHTVRGYLRAADAVRKYIIDQKHDGSVEYGYTATFDSLHVRRHTEIRDNQLTLTVDVTVVEVVPIQLPRRTIYRTVPATVRLVIVANENNGQTKISATAIATADLSDFHSCLGRAVARRRAPGELHAGLASALATAETKGRRIHDRGHVDIDAMVDGFLVAAKDLLSRRTSAR